MHRKTKGGQRTGGTVRRNPVNKSRKEVVVTCRQTKVVSRKSVRKARLEEDSFMSDVDESEVDSTLEYDYEESQYEEPEIAYS